MQKNILPKGKYYVGDPCYIFDKSWDKVLDDTDFFNKEGVVDIFGFPCFAAGTAYGDGEYRDDDGRKYYVDAGLIGVLPVRILEIDGKETIESVKASEGMQIIEFPEDFMVSASGGFFQFGDIEIDTRDEGEDDYFYGGGDEEE